MAIAPMFKEGFGAETEYAPQPIPAQRTPDRCYTPALFNHPALTYPKAFSEFGLLAGKAQFIGRNLHLLNGGRIYPADPEGRRVEYATPECRTLDEIVYAVLAGNYIMPQIFNTLDRTRDRYKLPPASANTPQTPHRHTVIATNADHAGIEFTTVHENYSISDQMPDARNLFRLMIPFLVSRQLYTGAGHISPNGEFFLSPAAYGRRFSSNSFIKERLHLQLGDFNMSPDVIRLKFGATLCLMETMAQGWRSKQRFLNPDDAPRVNVSINGSMVNPQLPQRRTLFEEGNQGKRWVFVGSDGRTHSALDIQYECLDAIDHYLGHDPNPDIQWVRHALRKTLDALGKDDINAPWLDWTVKYDQYQKLIGDRSMQRIKDMVRLDRSYHYWDMLNREASVYPLLAAAHPDQKKIITAMTTPPQTTRAKVRGEVVQKMLQKSNRATVQIDWAEIGYDGELFRLAIDQTNSPVLRATA